MGPQEGKPEAGQQAILADNMRAKRPRFDVVGFGALNLDHVYAVPQLVVDGGVPVTASSVEAGGSAANTVYALAKLGRRCGFVGVIGDDEAGRMILDSFHQVGVDTSGIAVYPGTATGRTICITAGQRQKAIYILPGANDSLSPDSVDMSYLSDTRYVHVSSYLGESAFRCQLDIVRDLPDRVGTSLALDAVYAGHGLHALSDLLERCSVLFANGDELQQLTDRDLHSAIKACLDIGCKVVAATFGGGKPEERRVSPSSSEEATACVVAARPRHGHRILEHSIPAVRTHSGDIADTIGAGDAFAGGFLFGLLQRRHSLPACGALGHTAAGFCLTELGARKGLPTKEELLARFDESFRSLFERERKSEPVPDSI
jgi:ribokinase